MAVFREGRDAVGQLIGLLINGHISNDTYLELMSIKEKSIGLYRAIATESFCLPCKPLDLGLYWSCRHAAFLCLDFEDITYKGENTLPPEAMSFFERVICFLNTDTEYNFPDEFCFTKLQSIGLSLAPLISPFLITKKLRRSEINSDFFWKVTFSKQNKSDCWPFSSEEEYLQEKLR